MDAGDEVDGMVDGASLDGVKVAIRVVLAPLVAQEDPSLLLCATPLSLLHFFSVVAAVTTLLDCSVLWQEIQGYLFAVDWSLDGVS